MPFAAALSTHPAAAEAVGEVVGRLAESLDGRPDVVVAFLTGHHIAEAEQIAATIQTLLDPATFVGATAVAVLAGPLGVEDAPGLAVWAAQLPGSITPVHLAAVEQPDGWRIEGLPAGASAQARTLILLADPFTFPTGEFLKGLATSHPELATVGGLASAARIAGGNRLIIGGRVVRHGAVGLLFDATVAPASVVSQGCRPIGQPWTVTRSEGNVIFELAGRPALERLMEIIEGLGPEDRGLAGQGLHCGIVADERKLDYERGDFLIRGVLGADRKVGAVAVGEVVPIGATVQFQVRDAATAGEDLRTLLGGHTAHGALVFTCNGRGTFMFGSPHHDAEIIEDELPGAAVAGMFCAGEIGPVAGTNALHGFTASVALFTD
jgi:small ligand-binding sensory domain FIST